MPLAQVLNKRSAIFFAQNYVLNVIQYIKTPVMEKVIAS